jgi:hypothetical protein
MKRAAIFAVTLAFGAFGSVFGQGTATQYIDNAIQTAENVQQDVQTASNVIDQLVVELTITGNPDAAHFHSQLFFHINNAQNNADDINYFTLLAEEASPVPFSTAGIFGYTEQIVVFNDDVIGLTQQITEAIEDNRDNDAVALIPQLRDALAAQFATAGDILAELEAIRSSTLTFEVHIQLVDYQGNPVYYSDLRGYYTYSHATGEYLYPERDDNRFFLPAGTYTFDSFDGYWSGTGSTTVTLSEALVNEDGIIIVELVYWSE